MNGMQCTGLGGKCNGGSLCHKASDKRVRLLRYPKGWKCTIESPRCLIDQDMKVMMNEIKRRETEMKARFIPFHCLSFPYSLPFYWHSSYSLYLQDASYTVS